MDKTAVTVGKVYQHYQGGKYVVLFIGRMEQDHQVMVGYRRINGPLDEIWIRPYEVFVDKFNQIEQLPIFTAKDLNGTTHAQIWAEAFLERHPGDLGDLIGWFANALMVGYDHALRGDSRVRIHDHGGVQPTESTPEKATDAVEIEGNLAPYRLANVETLASREHLIKLLGPRYEWSIDIEPVKILREHIKQLVEQLCLEKLYGRKPEGEASSTRR